MHKYGQKKREGDAKSVKKVHYENAFKLRLQQGGFFFPRKRDFLNAFLPINSTYFAVLFYTKRTLFIIIWDTIIPFCRYFFTTILICVHDSYSNGELQIPSRKKRNNAFLYKFLTRRFEEKNAIQVTFPLLKHGTAKIEF